MANGISTRDSSNIAKMLLHSRQGYNSLVFQAGLKTAEEAEKEQAVKGECYDACCVGEARVSEGKRFLISGEARIMAGARGSPDPIINVVPASVTM
uniref:Uncharacterized protein n=1 Tax=Sphaerodactylus townsendi TaxID=933632 RepID=A0ACB8G7C8_9SAUR